MAGLPPFIPLPGAPGFGLGLPKFGASGGHAEFGAIYDRLHGPAAAAENQTPELQAPAKSLADDLKPSQKVTVVPGTASMIGDLGKPLSAFLDSVNQLQVTADQKQQELATGGDVELHDVMLASEKASLAVDLTMQVRNKLVDAYQEIMRMSV